MQEQKRRGDDWKGKDLNIRRNMKQEVENYERYEKEKGNREGKQYREGGA